MCHQSNLLGNQKDSTHRDEYAVSRNDSSFLYFRSTHVVAFILGLALDPRVEWQRPEKVTNLPPAITIPTFKANTHDLAITDCKSLYDLTTRTAIPNCQEYRTQLLAR